MAYGNGGAAIGSGYSGADVAVPSRPPMISMEMERQSNATERLHNLISELSGRLSAVLRPDGPQPAGTEAKNPQAPVPLAGVLSDQNNRIEGACRRLQDIFERIEL